MNDASPDPVLEALATLEEVLEANDRRSDAMRRRMEAIRRQRADGRGYRDIVSTEHRPLVVELLTRSAQGLDSAGAAVRRTEALALHEEGMTMDEIARHFGVTRQRVSALLREARNGNRRG